MNVLEVQPAASGKSNWGFRVFNGLGFRVFGLELVFKGFGVLKVEGLSCFLGSSLKCVEDPIATKEHSSKLHPNPKV